MVKIIDFDDGHGNADIGNAFIETLKLAGAIIYEYKYVYLKNNISETSNGKHGSKQEFLLVANIEYMNIEGWIYFDFGVLWPSNFPLGDLYMEWIHNLEYIMRYGEDFDDKDFDPIFAKYYINTVLFDHFYKKLEIKNLSLAESFNDMIENPEKYEKIYDEIIHSTLEITKHGDISENLSCDICRNNGVRIIYRNKKYKYDGKICENCQYYKYEGWENDIREEVKYESIKFFEKSKFFSVDDIIKILFKKLKSKKALCYDRGENIIKIIEFLYPHVKNMAKFNNMIEKTMCYNPKIISQFDNFLFRKIFNSHTESNEEDLDENTDANSDSDSDSDIDTNSDSDSNCDNESNSDIDDDVDNYDLENIYEYSFHYLKNRSCESKNRYFRRIYKKTDLWTYKSFCKEISKKNPKMIQYIDFMHYSLTNSIIDEDFCNELLKTDKPHLIKLSDIPKNLITKEISEFCLMHNEANLNDLLFVHKDCLTRELCIKAVKYNAFNLKYIPETMIDEKFCDELMKTWNPGSIYLPRIPDKYKTKKLVDFCLTFNINNIVNVSPEYLTKEIVEKMFKTRSFFDIHDDKNDFLSLIPQEWITSEMIEKATVHLNDNYDFIKKMPEDKLNQKICNTCASYINWHPYGSKKGRKLESFIPEKFITYDICRIFIKGYKSIYEIPLKCMTKELYNEIKKIIKKYWSEENDENMIKFEEYIKNNNLIF